LVKDRISHYKWRIIFTAWILTFVSGLLFGSPSAVQGYYPQDDTILEITCSMPFQSVATPLSDLNGNEYIRMEGGPTGAFGGLYPGGSNTPPSEHLADGMAIAASIIPLNPAGVPDLLDGKIGMISIGMSNTAMAFQSFRTLAYADPAFNPRLRLVNGAQAGQTADLWEDPESATWEVLDQRLDSAGVTQAQVQVAWVKLVIAGGGNFPEKPRELQQALSVIVQNLKTRFPNIKLVYLSSRTRSYTYWNGLSPEPAAYESGFAVKWLVQDQINGDPALNFDPANGPVTAPYLAWGAYLWADGTNPRSDGLVWLPEDMVQDCTHPSQAGQAKVANMLLAFYKSDPTTGWFLQQYYTFLPVISSP
jgi:hypothetical protein